VRDDRYKLIVNLLADRSNPVAGKYLEYGRDVTRASIANSDPAFRRAWKTFAKPPATELYDLKSDPYEMNNLADNRKHAQTLKRLRGKLMAWQTQTTDPLADPAKLNRLTQEHDTLKIDYRKDPSFRWRYLTYLR
jgi:arylsulfatase A-like enzyme